jgi:excisionase family DNA binding protein
MRAAFGTMSKDLAFTSTQAARYLGVATVTIRRWCEAGYLSHYRTPGGQFRFSRKQLDAFLDEHRSPNGDRPSAEV